MEKTIIFLLFFHGIHAGPKGALDSYISAHGLDNDCDGFVVRELMEVTQDFLPFRIFLNDIIS